jgi:hypothetical protein
MGYEIRADFWKDLEFLQIVQKNYKRPQCLSKTPPDFSGSKSELQRFCLMGREVPGANFCQHDGNAVDVWAGAYP